MTSFIIYISDIISEINKNYSYNFKTALGLKKFNF